MTKKWLRYKAMAYKTLVYLFVCIIFSPTTWANTMEDNKPILLCSSKPNCVSTDEIRESHQIAPFVLTSEEIKLSQIEDVLLSFDRSQTQSIDEENLHVTFTSRVFRFVDDVHVVKKGTQLHVRSKSRTGYSDLGVNRNRMDEFRQKLLDKGLIEAE